ncbi:MAG: hypothetical protein EPN60_13255 [Nevskiaceae bacterium]|nr:MAG: hypothetical protein EPN60_13255 [Nevskiaceae bacterium]
MESWTGLARNTQRPEAARQGAAIKHLGKPPETQYRHSQNIAIREIATMNNERLTAETHREMSPAKLMGFGRGVFLQARWA